MSDQEENENPILEDEFTHEVLAQEGEEPIPNPEDEPLPEEVKKESHRVTGYFFLVLVVASVMASITMLMFSMVFDSSVKSETEIGLSLMMGSDPARLDGRVLVNGQVAENAAVWAVIEDDFKNTFVTPNTKTDETGGFTIVMDTSGPSATFVSQVTVYVQGKSGDVAPVRKLLIPKIDDEDATFLETETTPIAGLAVLFAASMLIGFYPVRSQTQARIHYFLCLSVAFLFTVFVILAVTFGLKAVHETESNHAGFTLGFANIYQATYVENVPRDWVLSFTAPSIDLKMEKDWIDDGFGAPLWVILIAVIGAGVFALLVMLKAIDDPPNYADKQHLNRRMSEVVKHQFFILFSPMSGIVLYQFLVVSGSANVSVTVAMAALGAGVVSTPILDHAVNGANSLLAKSNNGGVVEPEEPE